MHSLPHARFSSGSLMAAATGFGLALAAVGGAQSKIAILDPAIVHLGDTLISTWEHGTPEPVGTVYEVTFEVTSPNVVVAERCLLLTHFDVDSKWVIRVNDLEVGLLEQGKVLREHLYVIPPRTLRSGSNVLRVQQVGGSDDDILIGVSKLVHATLRDHLGLRRVRVLVRDAKTDLPVPARITITDDSARAGELVRVYDAVARAAEGRRGGTKARSAEPLPAVRDGIVYVADHEWVEFEVPSGPHRIDVSRGMEWSVATGHVGGDDPATVALAIEREVDTTGYIACDSHIHTFEFSRHGDASLDERIVTLAGEGVELAIATDHNHNIDYAPRQRELGLGRHYRSVVGNEVTTDVGHFNAFPLDPSDPVPGHSSTDWVRLVEGMRSRGARVVVLNHPRWPQIATGPFGVQKYDLDRVSGTFRDGPKITFDAVEIVNSTTEARDPLFAFVDWFALLNHGDHVMGVGTSDSHTVGDPVGQGRTYLRCAPEADADPRKIDVTAACDAIREGRGSIAQGIFVEVRVAKSIRMGGLVEVSESTGGVGIPIDLRVAAASWVRPREAFVFVNGERVADQRVQSESDVPTDTVLHFEIPTPRNDAHLVCVVLGDGVRGRHWRMEVTNDYTLGATNPVWIDADGDGEYTSPREQARRLLKPAGGTELRLAGRIDAFLPFDDAVAIQAIDLARRRSAPGEAGGDPAAWRQDLEEFADGLGRDAIRAFVRDLR